MEAHNYFSKVHCVTEQNIPNMYTYAFAVGHKHHFSVDVHTNMHTRCLGIHITSEERKKNKVGKVSGGE